MAKFRVWVSITQLGLGLVGAAGYQWASGADSWAGGTGGLFTYDLQLVCSCFLK